LAAQGEPEAIAELEGLPEIPGLAAHLWDAFVEMSRTRAPGGMGGSGAITRHDIRQWEQDEFTVLAPWERRAVLALDRAWMTEQAAESAAKSKRGG
jgi:hypothetical protein